MQQQLGQQVVFCIKKRGWDTQHGRIRPGLQAEFCLRKACPLPDLGQPFRKDGNFRQLSHFRL
ncbi:hypothetical protein GGR59_003556 [Xanthomonas arboricola]|nr:hypothetical protein [Xanthomonas arboricola]